MRQSKVLKTQEDAKAFIDGETVTVRFFDITFGILELETASGKTLVIQPDVDGQGQASLKVEKFTTDTPRKRTPEETARMDDPATQLLEDVPEVTEPTNRWF